MNSHRHDDGGRTHLCNVGLLQRDLKSYYQGVVTSELYLEDRCNMFLRKDGNHLQDYKAS